MKTNIAFSVILFSAILLTGCASLLPTGDEVAKSRWHSFNDIKTEYDRVIPNKTTVKELKKYGFDIYSTPNTRILNYFEIARNVQAIKEENLDPGLSLCLRVKDECIAYEFSAKITNSERYGNFWLDLFSFKRKTHEKGWSFKSIFVIVNNIVVSKLWSGEPNIDKKRQTKNPLGPLQDAGGGLLINTVP